MSLDWVVNEKKIAPHIPVKDMSRREDGSMSRKDFTFDKKRNVYVCPAGKLLLHTTGYIHDGDDTALSCKGLGLTACGRCSAIVPVGRIVSRIHRVEYNELVMELLPCTHQPSSGPTAPTFKLFRL